ncbi:alpha-mannosidase [Geothrix oryzae]|uniref:Alpha-mannosidase n=1 Tax=Geothrix oryzae TaxID=2927975 RepID=A0ABM8DPA2_9BACT|nr:alpha-mannosidase [Geothrix oryzae]BDU68785.1 alpha-mannosidase [Geothrix oryzae]
MRLLRTAALTGLGLALAAAPPDLSKERTLYVMNYSHLDTQWRWSYPLVVREMLRNTLYDNFALMEQHPEYVFNWSGAGRYQMFQEYFPGEYARLKGYVAKGQWFPAGSAWEESDVNVPSSESLIRQLLLGHTFFKREFGTESSEYMLPDCFGFPASLPSILAHCGLKGFSTQKLTWGSANGVPFNVGRWEGPDGRSIIAALNPGSYDAHLTTPLTGEAWVKRLDANGVASGLKVDYLYNGNGDEGSAPFDDSLRTLWQGLAAKGPVKVIAGRADLMFEAITEAQKAKLPGYKGDLLLTQHSAGSLTSAAFMKRMNRQDELLADAAEKASVAADLLQASPYPATTLEKAWGLMLRNQFHDILPGTSLPKAYEYSWNDGLLAAKAFEGMLGDAVGAVARGLDTRVEGVPIVVYNALGIARMDLVEALLPPELEAEPQVTAVDAAGAVLPTQMTTGPDGRRRVLFQAHVPSLGFAVYGLRPGKAPAGDELKVQGRMAENARYRVKLNEAGDIESVFDKELKRELLSAPARLAFQHEKPQRWPAWNMDWADRQKPPRAHVSGPAAIRVSEDGPVRVALEVIRESEGSRFVQTIRLAAGAAGDRVEVANLVDWKTSEASLKATFPLAAAQAKATYNLDLGTLERGNNDPKKYEVPTHGWMDLTDAQAGYGVTLLTGAKYGTDKPDDHTLRLTLLYTPGVGKDYREQRWQDWGRHSFTYGLAGHSGGWQGAPWLALRQDQPLAAFAVPKHAGPLGRSFSLLRTSTPDVAIQALKRSEDGTAIVVRLQELRGSQAEIDLRAAGPIRSAKELDGLERPLAELPLGKGTLNLAFRPYQLRTIGLQVETPARLASPSAQPLPLPFDAAVFSTNSSRMEGGAMEPYASYPSEMMGEAVEAGGIRFQMGQRGDGQKNALTCAGQTLALPEGTMRAHLLVAATSEDVKAAFMAGDRVEQVEVPRWTGYLGSWDNRVFKGEVDEKTYSINNDLERIAPAFLKAGRPVWWASHRHAKGQDDVYAYSYLFAFAVDLPAGARTLTLPKDSRVKVFAVTTTALDNAGIRPLQPLFPDLARDASFGSRFNKP